MTNFQTSRITYEDFRNVTKNGPFRAHFGDISFRIGEFSFRNLIYLKLIAERRTFVIQN